MKAVSASIIAANAVGINTFELSAAQYEQTTQLVFEKPRLNPDGMLSIKIRQQLAAVVQRPQTFTLILTSDDLLEATSCFVVKDTYTFPVQPSLTLEGKSLYMIMPFYTQESDSTAVLELLCVNSVSAPTASGPTCG